MQGPSKRAAIYCRISETDEKVDKVERQREICTDLTTQYGYTVVGVYEDDGISAFKKLTRPGYDELIADAEAGKFDVAVAFRQDRFSRDWFVTAKFVNACQERGIVWHTTVEGYNDLAQAGGGALLAVLNGFQASAEQTKKIASISAAFDKRRAAGLPLWGNRPFGFEVNRIDHREDEANELRWAYERILAGATLYSIIKSWNDRGIETSAARDRREKRAAGLPVAFDERNRDRIAKGLPPRKEPEGWSYATIQQMLKRPRNAGLLQIGRDPQTKKPVISDVPAQWEPIVSREVWEEAVALLSDRSRAGSLSFEPKWLSAGIATCGRCGAPMRSARARDRKQSFPVYRCGRQAGGVPKEKAHTGEDGRRVTHAAVKCEELDQIVKNQVISTFLFAPSGLLPTDGGTAADLRRLQSRLREVQQIQADISELVGTPGFKVAVMKRRAGELAAEEQVLLTEIEALRRNSAHAAMLLESRQALFGRGHRVSINDAADRKAQLSARFEALTLEQQRTLVRSMLVITIKPGLIEDEDGKLHRASLDQRVHIENSLAPSLSSDAE